MKRRNKLTKTCNHCQRRKVKCDRKMPTCSACLEKRYTCSYMVKVNQVKRAEAQSLTKVQLIATVEKLRTQIKQNTQLHRPNPLGCVNYVSSKHGRVLSYGATSFRCTVKSPSLNPHFNRLWKNIKVARNRWKQENRYSSETETNSIEIPLSFITSGSILEALCTSLPSFEQILEYLQVFFKSQLFSYFAIVDPLKVLADVNTCLVRDKTNSIDSRVRSFALGEKKNYYRIGLITEILCLVYYRDKVPPAVRFFHKFITSFVLGKASYLERVQFFMLRYIYRNVTGFTGGDGGSCASLVALAFSTAVHIGLHRMENSSYFRDDQAYLSNLWLCVLYADFEISFSIGSPLHIGEEFVEDFLQKGDNYRERQGELLAFAHSVFFLRGIMRELYGPSVTSDLESVIMKLKLFYTTTFGPYSLYLRKKQIEPIKFGKLLFMLFALQLISNLSLIKIDLLGYHSYQLGQDVLFCQLSSLKLVLDNLESTYSMCGNMENSSESDYYINFSLALYLYHCMVPRITHELFSILSKSALAERGDHGSKDESLIYNEGRADLKDFVNLLDSYHEGKTEHCLDAMMAIDFLDKIYQTFIERAPGKLLHWLNQSYLFVLSDVFMTSTKQAIGSILSRSQNEEHFDTVSGDSNALDALFFDPTVDFFYDEDFPSIFD